MPPEIANITIACEDPDRLARFWAAALEYELQEAPPDFMEHWLADGRDPNGAAAIVDPEGRRPRFFFQMKQKTPTEVVPLHLDIRFDDPNAAVTAARARRDLRRGEVGSDRPVRDPVGGDARPRGQRFLRAGRDRRSLTSGEPPRDRLPLRDYEP